jgi:hypothetical protein
MRGWQGQPRYMVEYDYWRTKTARPSIAGL